MFKCELSTDCYLEMLQVHHGNELFSLIDKNRGHLREWLSWVDHVTKVEHSERNIHDCLIQFAENNGFRAGIFYKEELAGVINYHSIDWRNKKTSLGYWLGEEFQGKGLMTQAVLSFVNYAFQDLKLNRVEIRCAEGNSKSRAIPVKLGFTNEGTSKDSEWLYDHYVDHVIYGVTNDNWDTSK
jgi:ribosomal-protein-serine acetyltransferase